jgi:hypothetical protein
MVRTAAVAFVGAVFGLFCLVGEASAQKAARNQMVRGTIKSVDVKNSVLIVNQRVKSSTVQRELDILPSTEFVITIGKEKKEVAGKEGLELLEGHVGAPVTVKCDKDVKVLKVTVRICK